METQIRQYILDEYPNEICGVICSDCEFIPVTNISTTPESAFIMNPIELLNIQKEHNIQAIVHSHSYSDTKSPLFDTHPCTPSHKDYINQQTTKYEWRIYATEGENVTPPVIFPQSRDTELLDRNFIFYINDCYTLVRDFYYQKFNIDLMPHSVEWNWEEGSIAPCYEIFSTECGFNKVPITELKYGDVIVMSILGDCNHAGIYVGDSMMIHHLVHRKSSEVLVNRMDSFIQFALRYNHVT